MLGHRTILFRLYDCFLALFAPLRVGEDHFEADVGVDGVNVGVDVGIDDDSGSVGADVDGVAVYVGVSVDVGVLLVPPKPQNPKTPKPLK